MGPIKILLTGSTGFIGSKVLEYFSHRSKYSITCINRRSVQSRFEERNIVIDLNDRIQTHEKLKDASFDVVVHLAGESIATTDGGEDLSVYRSNVVGLTNLLESLDKTENLKKFIFFSTSHVYSKTQPNLTLDTEIKPESPYAISKSMCELLLYGVQKKYNFSAFILRCSNIYGDSDPNSERIVPTIVNSLKKDLVAELKSPLDTGRDYLNFRDLNDLLEKILDKDVEKGVYSAFNVGSGVVTKIEEIIKISEEITGTHLKIKNLGGKIGGDQFALDISKTSEAFDWMPRISMNEGLKSLF